MTTQDPIARDPLPLPLRPLRFLLVTALWSIPFAIFFTVVNGGGWKLLWVCYQVSLIFSFTIRLGLAAAKQFVEPRLADWTGGEPHWALYGSLYMVTALIGSYVAAFLVARFIWHRFMSGPTAWIASGMFALLFSLLFAGIIYARVFYRKAEERGAQVERIRGELARAELRALRAQVNPHFLFNTLNAIASLITENPRAAEDLTTRLADVFRYALGSARHETVRFADELEFLRNWLAIEHARFGDRLHVVEDIAPGLDDVPVPGLLLQPLVENAVLYAIAPRAEGGTLTIRAGREGESLRVTIADDGPGFVPGSPPHGHGMGLEGVRERMRLAGPGHAIEIDSRSGAGSRITVTLPCTPSPAIPSPGSPDTKEICP
jgi:sensor histidine kinase YesM